VRESWLAAYRELMAGSHGDSRKAVSAGTEVD